MGPGRKKLFNLWNQRYREARTRGVEFDYLDGQISAVLDKTREVLDLLVSTKALGERVKQMIEIMDEDHGKAIRVFTVVTVLFLPMYVALSPGSGKKPTPTPQPPPPADVG